MSKTGIRLDTIEQVASTEIVSDRVSEKYIPIFTTSIIKIMNPEFKFKGGIRYHKSTSTHTVYLKDDMDTISITNSYDRTSALRFDFMVGSFHIPLNLEYQKHIGKNAATLVEDLKVHKAAILEAVKMAKITERNLKELRITESFKKTIKDEVFRDIIKNKNFVKLDISIGDSFDTFYKYIDTLVSRFDEGDYFVTSHTRTGVKLRRGIKIKSRFRKLLTVNKINELLLDKYPEVFV